LSSVSPQSFSIFLQSKGEHLLNILEDNLLPSYAPSPPCWVHCQC
jgi:hypothetical protein